MRWRESIGTFSRADGREFAAIVRECLAERVALDISVWNVGGPGASTGVEVMLERRSRAGRRGPLSRDEVLRWRTFADGFKTGLVVARRERDGGSES